MTQKLQLGFTDVSLSETLSHELKTPGVTPASATSRFVSSQLTSCIEGAIGSRLLKTPAIRHSGPRRYETLSRLAQVGYEAWYTELRFSTRKCDAVGEVSIEPFGIVLEPISYGFGIERAYQIKVSQLKTQANHQLRLNHIKVPAQLFSSTLDTVAHGVPLAQPYIANPEPTSDALLRNSLPASYQLVAFDHIFDGSRIFCSCAQTVHNRMRSSAKNVVSQYSTGSWPHRVLELLASPTYVDGICHLCISKADGPEAAALRYGDDVQEFEASYIVQLSVGLDLDHRTARAEVQQLLGLSRWKSEAQLFQIVKTLLPETAVLREASPSWLGRQRLDIFVPDLKLAIEYQGIQHFKAVPAFGGEDGLRRAAERDIEKKRLCNENGIVLIYVLHTDAITPASLKQRLRRFLPDKRTDG